MYSRFLSVVLLAFASTSLPAAEARVLRVCADPDNLPYSREGGSGFENQIAALVAESLGATLEYYWFPERRGYLRKTLDLRQCDLVVGLLAGSERALTTRPYYRGTYVLAYRRDRVEGLVSLDDPRLRELVVGVPLVGNDLAATPPAYDLAQRGVTDNVVGFPMFGEGTATERMTAALVEGTIDVALMWGPQAGYFARRSPRAIELVPLRGKGGDPYEFDISMGVRSDDRELARDIEGALAGLQPRIDRILDEFAVVRLVPQ